MRTQEIQGIKPFMLLKQSIKNFETVTNSIQSCNSKNCKQ